MNLLGLALVNQDPWNPLALVNLTSGFYKIQSSSTSQQKTADVPRIAS
jgi:hypothetical protein